MTELEIIEKLRGHKAKIARMQVLSSYSVGAGFTLSRLNEDDQLQELHRKLRGLPSYLYLTEREQKLEGVAHAYLTRYPVGTREQLREVAKQHGADEEDWQLLGELKGKIRKVIQARGWDWEEDVFDSVISRVAELQDLQQEINEIENALSALESYKPEYARLLRLRYVDGLKTYRVAMKLEIPERTLLRRQKKAVREIISLMAV